MPALFRPLLALLALTTLACACRAETLLVAVAANFAPPARQIAADFERETGHSVKLSFGATGKFYAQIRAGAPFDVLLAADEETPRRLVDEGLGAAGTEKTYAVGKLVLWSVDPTLVDREGEVLKSDRFKHLALADARLAPYGMAAREVLTQLQLMEQLQSRLVVAENIGQAHQFVATANAELGFVALSQVQTPDGTAPKGSMWLIPERLYTPLRQNRVVLTSTKVPNVARAFADYLSGGKARATMRAYGYTW